jgi:hypothetical protein
VGGSFEHIPREVFSLTQPIVAQLRFTRQELLRCLEGISPEDARRRIGTLNCVSWVVGHLASQENAYWVLIAQDRRLYPELHKLVGTGQPASTPPYIEMLAAWHEITAAADQYLDTLTTGKLQEYLQWRGEPRQENIGTMLLRNIYHYWYHIGEAAAIRQVLGHTNLPQFVGDMSAAAYRRDED